MSHPTSSADGVAWNLHDLYGSLDDPQLKQDLSAALRRAQAFESTYRGKIETAQGPSVDLLLQAVQELESLSELMDRPAIYATLVHAAKTDDPRHGALVAFTREQRTSINKHLIFFDLEWVKVADGAAAKLLNDPRLARYRHFLEQKRSWRPHYLTEPEEKIVELKATTGRGAFVRLFDETVASIQFPFEHSGQTQRLSLQQLNAKLHEPDRSVREAAAKGLSNGLQENARLLTFIQNNLVLEHRSDCDLRHFPDPMGPRHLANEISAATVDALMTAAERHQTTVQRYYRLKGKLLGLEPLYDYDRYAPLFSDQPECDWSAARDIVQSSYAAFSPKAGAIIREFFDKKWIDAALRPGKRSGAFSSSAVPSAHPYILMNYTDKLRDVMTLAHELGHGLHQYLSRPIGYLQCDTPLTLAEMASVFGEMLTFQRLLQIYTEPRIRLAMLCSKIEDGFATVFRQVVLTRFEQAVHKERHEQGELPTERLNELWLTANRPMHGDVVRLTDGYAWWWMYIGHFIHVPFYCYAYAFGELLVLALVQKYKQDGAAFVPKYLELLSSGGSEAPHVLLGRVGVDVTDPNFWELGLRLLGDMVTEAEQLAAQLRAEREWTVKSDHFDGRRFHNPGRVGERSLWQVLRWALTRKKQPWPKWIDDPPQPAPPARVAADEIAITFVNHATFLLQLGGVNVLTDPVWSERVSPVQWAGPRRVRRPGIAFEQLPPIDVVLISHSHYDHLDLPTLRRLQQRDSPLFVTGLGNRRFLNQRGLPKVEEIDWWQTFTFRDGYRFTMTPALHYSRRGLFDQNVSLWGGFWIEFGTKKIYFAGDTAYGGHFMQMRERLGSPDVALLPIGAYEPRWFMAPAHMNPEEAVLAHLDLSSALSIAMHFGTFQLTDEPIDEPVRALRESLTKQGIDEQAIRVPAFGETLLHAPTKHEVMP